MTDSSEKLFAYQTIPSLQEYLLISQAYREIQIFRRKHDWATETCNEGSVRLDCLGFDLPLDLIYEDVAGL